MRKHVTAVLVSTLAFSRQRLSTRRADVGVSGVSTPEASLNSDRRDARVTQLLRARTHALRLPPRTVALALALIGLAGAAPTSGESAADRELARYFEQQTKELARQTLTGIKSLEDWTSKRDEYRRQLLEMLGLWPLPERTDLRPQVTRRVDHADFIVENLHFQSLPNLYVTGNLYLPKTNGPAPAVLYVCGHARVVRDGISYGNKTAYQHHGEWLARNGYVCLTIDTIQLGEIEGLHHGTYREGMWWWNSRGYTPAGVEAWNSLRALDYLETRPEVDATRFGMTGRSGGGAYSWWLAAIDERVQVVAPVAGITDLVNHVVDGTVEGHCDCMFMVNTYRWDYPLVAALVAPRPLLIANNDKDSIFPLDGVLRVHARVRDIYRLYGAADKLGLLITEGPHKDTQDLQLPVFRWFNRHLRGEDPLIEMAAERLLDPAELRVFDRLPEDERTSSIHETFVPPAPEEHAPASRDEWAQLELRWKEELLGKVFRGWPETQMVTPPRLRPVLSTGSGGLQLDIFQFFSQPDVQLPLVLLRSKPVTKPEQIDLRVLDGSAWEALVGGLRSKFGSVTDSVELARESPQGDAHTATDLDQLFDEPARDSVAVAFFAPRGMGATAWDPAPRKQVQIRRRFMLLGQTLDGMRVWDIRSALRALRSQDGLNGCSIGLSATGPMAVNSLYASLFEPPLQSLDLTNVPSSHRSGPDYLNVLRILDIPQAAAMAAAQAPVELEVRDRSEWRFPIQTCKNLNWGVNQLLIRESSSADP